jgi:5'-nucleotidase (lipoprotein e(P4) family)
MLNPRQQLCAGSIADQDGGDKTGLKSIDDILRYASPPAFAITASFNYIAEVSINLFLTGGIVRFKLATLLLAATLPLSCAKHTPSYHDGLGFAALWTLTSAEAQALSLQAFKTAEKRLADVLKNKKRKKPLAIVTDIDQTILNGAYNGWLAATGSDYPAGRDAWIAKGNDPAMPGAKAFLDFANANGVKIFYVTSRKEINRPGTMKNLKLVNFPQVNDQQVFLKTSTMRKKQWRDKIATNHTIALLLGDKLDDFHEVFEQKVPTKERANLLEQQKDKIGSTYILVPNPMYGKWETSLYGYRSIGSTEKMKIRKNQIQAVVDESGGLAKPY